MKTSYVVGLIALIAVAVVIFLFIQRGASPAEPDSEKGVVTSSDIDFGEDADKPAEVRAEGITYEDPQGKFRITYPADYTFDDSDALHPRLYKRGDEQRPQSEMSDGVLLVFEKIDLNGQTLEKMVDDRLQQATADGTSEVIEPKDETTLGTYPGFEYELRGLGTARYLYVQASEDADWALSATYSISDPKTLGYQVEVDSILATLELSE